MALRTERAQQGDMLDLMCWRVYGKTEGRVEKVLELTGLPEILPLGALVTLPEILGGSSLTLAQEMGAA